MRRIARACAAALVALALSSCGTTAWEIAAVPESNVQPAAR